MGCNRPLRDETEAYRHRCPERFSAYDLRFRSLDRQPHEPIYTCSECRDLAEWSIWLHTPEWGTGNAGDTRVLCTPHAIERVLAEVRRASR